MKPRQITNAEEDIVEEPERIEVTRMSSIGYQYMRKDLPSPIRQYPLHPNQCIMPSRSKSSNFMDIATLIVITSL